MRKVFLFMVFLVLIHACAMDRSKQIQGNWAYLDEELGANSPYTEVHVGSNLISIFNRESNNLPPLQYRISHDTIFMQYANHDDKEPSLKIDRASGDSLFMEEILPGSPERDFVWTKIKEDGHLISDFAWPLNHQSDEYVDFFTHFVQRMGHYEQHRK